MSRLRISWMFSVLFLVLSLSASAQPDWTRVGSTGTIDETAVGTYEVNGAGLFHAGGSFTNIVARFNVDNVSNQFPLAPWTTLELTAQDGSALGVVGATLFRVPRCSGTSIAVCSVSSTDAVASPTCTRCTLAAPLDFANNSYYVQVTVIRQSTAVTPILWGLRLF